MISNEWLTDLNDEYNLNGLAMQSRPWHAILKLATDSQIPITYHSSTAMQIFNWFHSLSSPTSEQPQFFVGAYLHNAQIIPVCTPVYFGSAAITPLQSLVTHLPSNILLILVPLMPNFTLAITMLLLRFSISQMDVPTRQAYTMAVVKPDERSAAAGITGIARSIGASLSPAVAGAILPLFIGGPFIIAGGLKIVYDLLLFRGFKASKVED
jgi:hypothetical protein